MASSILVPVVVVATTLVPKQVVVAIIHSLATSILVPVPKMVTLFPSVTVQDVVQIKSLLVEVLVHVPVLTMLMLHLFLVLVVTVANYFWSQKI